MPLAFVFDDSQFLERALAQLDKQGVSYRVMKDHQKTELWVDDANTAKALNKYYQGQFLNQQLEPWPCPCHLKR